MMGALGFAPIAYFVKLKVMESHSLPSKLAPMDLSQFEKKEKELAQKINETTELVYQNRDTLNRETLSNAITSDPIWLFLSVGLALVSLGLDFFAAGRK